MHLLLYSLCLFAAFYVYDETIWNFFFIKRKTDDDFRSSSFPVSVEKLHKHLSGFCFVNKTIVIRMMPVKEILKQRHVDPLPPILVIDEGSIKSSDDAGPICGCDEKYDVIKRYTPFIFGAVNPYKRREIPDTQCLEVYWKRLKIGEQELLFEKPVALHPSEIPENFKFPKEAKPEDVMFLRPHKYTDGYVIEKLRQCQREHAEECSCPNK